MNSNTQKCIQWIKDYYKDNPNGKAIIGISGGKDSTVAAALCVEALGAHRVVGVLMPNGTQTDIADSYRICAELGIEPMEINIWNICRAFNAATTDGDEPSIFNNPMVKTNLPARVRMTVLYMVAAFHPGSRVVNTCNRSEDYVGYSTKFGDAAGDFSPLGKLTVREILEIGDDLNLPYDLVHKIPSDGMCGKSDEDNLGFSYEELDNFLLHTGPISEETMEKIDKLHKSTRHKYEPMPMFDPNEVIIDFAQMSLFDYDKQLKRGMRAEIGAIDDAGTFSVDPYYQKNTPSVEALARDITKAMEETTRRIGVRI